MTTPTPPLVAALLGPAGPEIECAADHLPSHIDVDISGLQPGRPIRVSDLPEHPWRT